MSTTATAFSADAAHDRSITDKFGTESTKTERIKTFLKENGLEFIISIEEQRRLLRECGSPSNVVYDSLDYCGIDVLVFEQTNRIGISLKTQQVRDDGTSWATFTLRISKPSTVGDNTEFRKRLVAISKGGLFPRFSINAYIHNDKIVDMALVETKYLVRAIEDGAGVLRVNKTEPGHPVYFVAVSFSELDKRGIQYTRWTES